MRSIPFSILGLAFILTAAGIADYAIFPKSPAVAVAYLVLFLAGLMLVLASYCNKCPGRGAGCPHLFPGKLSALLPGKKAGPRSFSNMLSAVIGYTAMVLMPQLWLVWNATLLALFWAFMMAGGFVAVFLVYPACPDRRGSVPLVKQATGIFSAIGDKVASALRRIKRRDIVLLLMAGIVAVGYLSLGIFFIQPVGTNAKGVTIVYFRVGLDLPFISYSFFREPAAPGLPAKLRAIAKPIVDRAIVALPCSPGLFLLAPDGKDLQNAGESTSARQASDSLYYNPNFKNDRRAMITYFFIGHSNMAGYCAPMDTVTMPDVWLYNKIEGFYHGTDKDLSNYSGSPVLPFLKRMALLYPRYHFCGVKHTLSGITVEDYLAGGNDRFLIDKIKTLKKKSTVGGVLLMFGFDEGKDKKKAEKIDANLKRLIATVRKASGNPTLPFICGRYEENSDKNRYVEYHRYDDILIKKINSLEAMDPYVKLTPIRPISKKCFCDDHHYNTEGYQIWADDAAAIIQMNKLDFWNGQ